MLTSEREDKKLCHVCLQTYWANNLSISNIAEQIIRPLKQIEMMHLIIFFVEGHMHEKNFLARRLSSWKS